MVEMRETTDGISRAAITATEIAIRPYVRRTPILECAGTDFGIDAQLVFKLELMQHSGSFKARGAFANLLRRNVPPAGVVAASGGNHGAAVAYAAKSRGVPARIFVPTISSPTKISRIREYGGDLVIGGDRYADALAASEAWATESGALRVHAFDQVETILGQGTIGLELEEQAHNLDTLLVAVGGGGLIAGIAAWFAGTVTVVGVEPERSPTLFVHSKPGARSMPRPRGSLPTRWHHAGSAIWSFPSRSVTSRASSWFRDAAIVDAQRVLWSVARIAVEPGGAASLAALLSGGYVPRKGERVGILISGGNTER